MAQIVYGGLTLVGTAPVDVAHSKRFGVRQSLQLAERLRATYVEIYPRGNRRVSIAFAVELIFSSILEAEEFCHDHEGDLPQSGDLVLTLSDGSTTRTYADAVLESADPVQRGQSVTVAYTFLASAVS